jgi:chemotaxis protein CheX
MEKYATEFINLCVKVFNDLGNIPVSAGKSYTSEKGIDEEWEVSAIVGFGGGTMGMMSVSMMKSVALRLAAKLTGTASDEINGPTIDMLGEIANIIAGFIKPIMLDNKPCVLGLPLVVQDSGKDHSITWFGYSSFRNICIPFTIFKDDKFTLSVSV